MSTYPPIGYIIGFDFLPSIIDRMKPNRKEIFEEEQRLISQGFHFTELNAKLRPINKEDIKKIKLYLPEAVIKGTYPVPRIGKYVFEGNYSSEFNFISLITALRIIKEGDVRLSHTYMEGNAGHLLSYFYLPPRPAYDTGKMYDLHYNELGDLKEIALNIQTYNIRDDSEAKKIKIALIWFNKSYDEHFGRTNTNTMIDLMICSEALFLDDKNYRHTGSIIGTACSMLIGKDNNEREKIKKAFEHAYTVRNKEVHGGDTTRVNDAEFQQRLRNLGEFNDEIYSYIRRAMKKILI